MRFCFVVTYYPPYNFGGDGVHTRRLAEALVRKGHEDVAYIESACAIGMREMGYAFTTEAASVPHCSPEHLPFYVFLRDRIRYYGLKSDRWKRGLFRWRMLFRVRTRYFLTLGPLRRRLS